MCALRIYINKFIFKKVLLGIDLLLYILRAYINKIHILILVGSMGIPLRY